MPLNEEGFITRVSLRHSVSPDAVRRGAVIPVWRTAARGTRGDLDHQQHLIIEKPRERGFDTNASVFPKWMPCWSVGEAWLCPPALARNLRQL